MWDQLKQDARKLEGELELKIATFSRLCANLDAVPSQAADTISQGARGYQGAVQIATEITSLLQRLSNLHNTMESDVAGSDIRQYTVARHKDILQDYSQEFSRLSAQLNQAKDRAELLAGAKDVTPLLGVTVQPNSSVMARERMNLQSAVHGLDDLLGQAGRGVAELERQGGVIKGFSDAMLSASSKIPVINWALNSIRRQKSWDAIVLSAVIVLCSLLLSMYLLRKWFGFGH